MTTGSNCATYDQAGNITADGVNSYTIDAESRVCSYHTSLLNENWTNVYDAGSHRVAKGQVPSGASCFTGTGFNPSETDVLGQQGEQFSTLTPSGWQSTNVYANGQLLATYQGNQVYFALNDWLGTKRVVATGTGQVADTYHSLWFGDALAPSSGGPSDHHYTGQLRDPQSGLDYFGARYYGSSMGRWMSPDPKAPSKKTLMNPQKWNKYAYVLNNPLSLVDPDGMEEMTIVYRTFIAPPTLTFLGRTYAGDSRTFSNSPFASSRSTITVRIETDPSIRPGNPIISQTSSAGQSRTLDANGNTTASATQTQGLPTATGSRDANGNAVIGITQDVKNPLSPGPQALTPGISADLTMNFAPNGSSVTTTGTASNFPSQELNVTGADGTTTPVFQFIPPPGSNPFSLFTSDRKVNCTTTGTGSSCQ